MNETYTLLEFDPEYGTLLSIDLLLESAALLILVLLMVQYAKRKHRTFELSLFFQMCLLNLFMVIAFAVSDIVPAVFPFDTNTLYFIPVWTFCLYFILRIFSVTLFSRWLIFVEYTLHQSRDLLRRRFKPVMAVFIVAIAMFLLSIPVALYVCFNDVSPLWLSVHYALSIMPYIFMLFFIAASYVILYREKKYNRIPAYIRLTPTTLCVIAGFVADMLLGGFAILPLFFALGLLFADYYMFRRLSWIDPKTGFYNRKYLPELIRFTKKNQLTGATVIRLQTEPGNDDVETLLKSWAPSQSKIITMGAGLFLLVSEAVSDSVSERFLSLLTEQAKELGLSVEAGCETDPKAPVDKILTKYIPQKAV